MPQTIDELVTMITKRDGISENEAYNIIDAVTEDMEHAFYSGDLDLAEDILRQSLGLEPDYIFLFIG